MTLTLIIVFLTGLTFGSSFFYFRRKNQPLSLSLASQNRLNLMQAILDHSQSSIYVKDLNYRYLLVNKYTLQIFNLKEKQMIGKTDREIFGYSNSESSIASDEKVLKTEIAIQEEVMLNLQEVKHYFSINKTPLRDPRGKVYALCAIATNITKEKYAQEQLNIYLEKLESITTELMDAKIISEQAIKTKHAFLANMSHELRTPLNGIVGNVSLLINTETTTKQETYLKRINTAAKILMEIINQVMDFSKIVAGELHLESIPCQIEDLLEDCKSILISRAEEKKLKLQFKLPKEKLPKIFSDPMRLKQIFINLINNAIKFTEKGSVQVNLRLLEKNSSSLKILFEVIDTGIGIPEAKKQHLFEKFWQADLSHTRKFGGSGLGLAIVKEITDQMQGKITVLSQEGHGTQMSLQFNFSIANQ